jgi:hypothetical protein
MQAFLSKPRCDYLDVKSSSKLDFHFLKAPSYAFYYSYHFHGNSKLPLSLVVSETNPKQGKTPFLRPKPKEIRCLRGIQELWCRLKGYGYSSTKGAKFTQ